MMSTKIILEIIFLVWLILQNYFTIEVYPQPFELAEPLHSLYIGLEKIELNNN